MFRFPNSLTVSWDSPAIIVRIYSNNLFRFPNSLTVSWYAPAIIVRIYFNNLFRFPNSLTVSWDAPAIMVTNQKYKMYIQVEKLFIQYSENEENQNRKTTLELNFCFKKSEKHDKQPYVQCNQTCFIK